MPYLFQKLKKLGFMSWKFLNCSNSIFC